MIHTSAKHWVQDINALISTGFMDRTLLGILLTLTNLLTASFRATVLVFSLPNACWRIVLDAALMQVMAVVNFVPIMPDTPMTVAAQSTLLMAASHFRTNAGAHSNLRYNATHANTLNVRPPIATCLPLRCSLIDTPPMICQNLNAMPLRPSG